MSGTPQQYVRAFGNKLKLHYGKPFSGNSYVVYDKTLLIFYIPRDVMLVNNVMGPLWQLKQLVNDSNIIVLLGNKGKFVCFTNKHLSFLNKCKTFEEFTKNFLERDRISLIGLYFDYTLSNFFDWMLTFEHKNNSCCIPKKYLKQVKVDVPFVQTEVIKPQQNKTDNKPRFKKKIIPFGGK